MMRETSCQCKNWAFSGTGLADTAATGTRASRAVQKHNTKTEVRRCFRIGRSAISSRRGQLGLGCGDLSLADGLHDLALLLAAREAARKSVKPG